MAEASPLSPRPPAPGAADPPPGVRLEVRLGTARPVAYEVPEAGFLIGSVPGCDLRLPGTNLPPVLCLIAPGPDGVHLRRLALTQQVLLNGRPVAQGLLKDQDRLAVGGADILVGVSLAKPAGAPAGKRDDRPAAGAAALMTQVEAAREKLRRQMEDFREQVARFQTEQHQQEAEGRKRQLDWAAREAQIEARRQQLETQTRDAAANHGLWAQRLADMEREGRKLQEREAALATAAADLERREQDLTEGREDLARREAGLKRRAADVEHQQEEVATLRQDMAQLRTQLYDTYRERRDRLAGVQEAVNRAARKVQERKQALDAEVARAAPLRREQEARRQELDARAAELDQQQQQLAAERARLDARRAEIDKDLADRGADLEAREARLAEERQKLDRDHAQLRDDLLRLDRHKAALDQREKDLQDRVREIDTGREQLQKDSKEIEDQARQLDEWHAKLAADAEAVTKKRDEQEAAAAQVNQRAAAVEGQQAMLATLRTRLERIREELRREEQQLTEQRVRQEALETELAQRDQESQALKAGLAAEMKLREHERGQFAERSALMETAVAQLRQAREALARQQDEVRQREETLDRARAEQVEEAGLLQARAGQLEEQKQRLEADRQALRERADALSQAEQVRDALQEQLRKRAEELTARQKALAEQSGRLDTELAAIDARRAEADQARQQEEARLAGLREEIAGRAADLDRLQADLARREDALRQETERAREAGRAVGQEREALEEERGQWLAKQQGELAALARAQAELNAVQREVAGLKDQLPDLELRARAAADKLAQARQELRGHLAEVHDYARQSRADLEALSVQVQAEAEQVRQQEQALHQARDEHRLAVAAFRQHLVEWQARIDELKQSLARGETRLEQRQAQVAEQARAVESTTARLARQAEALEEQERVVAERRGEMDRHLEDMRQWYRRKLRELAGIDEAPPAAAEAAAFPPVADAPGSPADGAAPNDAAAPILMPEAPASILALTDDVDPGDRPLGELLRSLDLIDADTLTALLAEARRQRRSLRQMLLASGAVTLYQLALIEAGNLDSLVLGPVRVVDRLRVTPRETVYRVFDPRRGPVENVHCLLRHLSEEEAEDAVRPDEFRQRFAAAAAVQHPHLAATREVLDVAGRPAVLQDWPVGLSAADWPALAGVPGVWFRLLNQAALGLHTAHAAGLVHGHLHPTLIYLTRDGFVQLCGFGEPPWLVLPPAVSAPDPDVAGDLLALGQAAAAWLAPTPRRKGARNKPLPEPLQAILARLTAESPEDRYASAAALLDDLDRAGGSVPANGEAWDRLLREVRDNAAEDAGLRQSA